MKFTSCRGLLKDRKTMRRTLPSGQTHFTCAVKSEGPTRRRCATPFCVRQVCWLLVVKRTQRYLISSAWYFYQVIEIAGPVSAVRGKLLRRRNGKIRVSSPL